MGTEQDQRAPDGPSGGAPPAHDPEIVAHLEQSEERFHLLVDAVAEYAIFLLDPRGYVTSWNTGAERINGYTEAEILGQHFSRFYTPEDVAAGKPQRVLEEAARSGRYLEEGWRMRKDGTRFWASVVVSPLRDRSGALQGFGKVTRDLTERRRAEEESRNRQAAEEVARMRGEFLDVAAHELKTPLTSLRGMAQLTLRRYAHDGDLSPERVVRALRLIDAQAAKLGRLVEQLLDLSRLESGRLVLERRTADLGALTTGVVELYRSRGDGHRIRLEVPAEPVPASIDALRIEQVLTNLIDNALKYSPPDSPVTVRFTTAGAAPDRDPGGQPGGESGREAHRVRITVTDSGPGVPPEDRPHLFDRFFRSRATSDTAGMGLGLHISRQIVERHGGTVRLDFPPEGGAQAVVELDSDS